MNLQRRVARTSADRCRFTQAQPSWSHGPTATVSTRALYDICSRHEGTKRIQEAVSGYMVAAGPWVLAAVAAIVCGSAVAVNVVGKNDAKKESTHAAWIKALEEVHSETAPVKFVCSRNRDPGLRS